MKSASPRPIHSRSSNGFTLIESIISLTIVAGITLACGSVVNLAARSTTSVAISGPANSSTASTTQVAAIRNATDQITADLKMALSITVQTGNAITFTVPDRAADGTPETITYAWGGVGQSLTRQYNGGAALSIADNVQSFNLNYLSKVVTTAPVESAEQVLVSRDWPIPADIQSLSLASISAAENFSPALPGNAISWKITKLRFKLKRKSGATGLLTVHVNNVDTNDNPTGAALASATIDIATVSSSAWQFVDVPLTPIAGLAPGIDISVVVLTPSATSLGYLAYDGKAADASMGESLGNGTGSGFSMPVSTQCLEYYIYGTITTQP